jgi:hypothetical protein
MPVHPPSGSPGLDQLPHPEAGLVLPVLANLLAALLASSTKITEFLLTEESRLLLDMTFHNHEETTKSQQSNSTLCGDEDKDGVTAPQR